MIWRFLAPSSFRTSQNPFARTIELRMTTSFAPAVMTSGEVISLESMTVPGCVMRVGPVYGVRATPAGTPVVDAPG